MEKESIVLVGGGGHCKSCIDIIELDDRFQIAGILDKTDNINADILGYPVLGDDDLIESFANQGYSFLITVGQIRSTAIREKLYQRIKNTGGKLPVIVSPRAYVSKHAQIGEGSIIMHNVLINSCA
jgi:FlaA1/EpsC-like NDP-sugar epimerase